jgi:hypothetical protein
MDFIVQIGIKNEDREDVAKLYAMPFKINKKKVAFMT